MLSKLWEGRKEKYFIYEKKKILLENHILYEFSNGNDLGKNNQSVVLYNKMGEKIWIKNNTYRLQTTFTTHRRRIVALNLFWYFTQSPQTRNDSTAGRDMYMYDEK